MNRPLLPQLSYLTALALAPLLSAGCAQTLADSPLAADSLTTKVVESSQSDVGLSDRIDETRLAALATSAEVTRLPWTGPSWSASLDSINAQGQPGAPSPAEVYGAASGISNLADWVSLQHGVDSYYDASTCETDLDCAASEGYVCGVRRGEAVGRCIDRTDGLARGLAAAAILLPEPATPVVYNGVVFSVNASKALAAITYDGVSIRSEAATPDALHTLLGNVVGAQGESLVVSWEWDGGLLEQPVAGYRVVSAQSISADDAKDLIDAPAALAPGELHRGDEWDLPLGPLASSNGNTTGVLAGQMVTITANGEGETDLYVAFDGFAGPSRHVCADERPGPQGFCRVRVPSGVSQVSWTSRNAGLEPAQVDVKLEIHNPWSGSTDAWGPSAQTRTLVRVAMELDTVRAAAHYDDRALTADLGEHLETAYLEYLLELDEDGSIVGGAWIGQSRYDHPALLWAPTGLDPDVLVADGAIEPALVHAILAAPVDAQSDLVAEQQQQTIDGELSEGEWTVLGPFEADSGRLTASLRGTGDLDLYVLRDVAPNQDDWDCRPFTWSSDEDCSMEAPGSFFVAVNGWTAGSFTLDIQWTAMVQDSQGQAAATLQDLDVQGLVGAGEWLTYALPLPAGASVVIETESDDDVDLYVRVDALPDGNNFDASSQGGSADSVGAERLEWTAAYAQTLFVSVEGSSMYQWGLVSPAFRLISYEAGE